VLKLTFGGFLLRMLQKQAELNSFSFLKGLRSI